MPLEAKGYQVLGASIFGPEPLSRIHLEIQSGVTMMYGKNGTGKTRLLDQLTLAFQGVAQPKTALRPRPLVHTSVEVRPPSGDNAFVSALYEMLDVPRELQGEDTHREEFQSALLRRVDLWEDLELEDPLALIDYPELNKSQGFYLSLTPSGTTELGQWTIYLSAILSADEMQKLAKYGAALSEMRRSMVAPTSTKQEAFSLPFRLAQADEWYTEPFEIIRSDAGPVYVSTGSSPLDDWPTDIPVPLMAIGSIARGPAQVFVDSMSLEVIQETTLSLVSRTQWGAPQVEATAGSEVVLAATVQEQVAQAELETNRVLDVLADFPFRLRYDTGTPSDWFSGKPPRWVAVPREGNGPSIVLHELSFSQQKWVRFALSLFLSKSKNSTPRLLMVDEPEQGLHRQLEARISTGLNRLATGLDDLAVLGATHSPAFLDPRHSSNLLHVALNGFGRTTLTRLEVGHVTLDEESKRLGVTPSDILAMTRVALVVEGTHDQLVVETCLSEDLQVSGARVFIMRGTDHAAALADMQFLFDALDAPIVVVFDNVVQAKVTPIWQRAVAACHANDSRAAERILAELDSKYATKEERALAELGRRAIRVGRLSRIVPFGLSQPDILDYLAPSHFNLEGDDWEVYKAAFGLKKRGGESFKDFVRREYKAKINNEVVRQAAKAVVSVPDDLAQLGNTIRQLAYLGEIDDLDLAME